MKNKVKKVLQKASAIALVLGMSLSPCITGFGKVFAAEPDTNGDADVTYDVTIEDSEHGKVQFADSALKKLSFKEEDEVTIKTYPDSGYDLEKLSLYSDDGTEICSGTEGDEFSFEMPAANLTVKASFVKDSNDSSSKEQIKYKNDGTAVQKDLDGIDKDLQKYIGKGRRLAENWESMSQGIATISTNQNDTVTINPHDKTQYSSWVTHHFDVVNQDGSTDLGFCVQPNKGTPSGQFQAQVLNNDVIKYILMLYAGDPSGFVLGSHPENYAVCHAILSYVYTGSTKGLNAGDKAAIIDFVEVDLIPGAQQAAKDHATIYGRKWDDYTAYVAINDKQDIVWLSGNPKGDLDLVKSSANKDITNGNDCYSLEGAVYGVYDKNGTEVSRITTDANGNAKAEKLAAGNYTIKEIQAPKGYEKDDTVYSCTVPSGGTVQLKVADNPGNDPAAIEISKIDQETGSLSTQGAASLEGAQFTLTHYGKYYTEEQIKSGEADKDAEENGVAKRTWVVETKEKTFSDKSKHYITGLNDEYKVSGDDFYYTEGNKNATLPLGTLVVEETKAPQGYNLDGAYFTANGSTDKIDGKYVAQITKEGNIVKLNGGNEYSVSDRVIRGDISFTKMDEEEQSRMAGIPFKITSNTTGESHTVVTDENGYFSSASSFNKHSKDTNGGKADSGLWFGLNADGENVKVNDEYGAFPYDTYTIEEQRCDANQDKALYKGTFTVSRDNYQIDLGTIDNPDLTISTTVKDEETNSHYAQACDDVTLIDTVSYTGLKKNKEYTLSGVLVDKETGEPVLDQNGNQVTATTKFKPKTAEGTAEVEFAFDATGFDGKTLVVYEELTLNGEKLAEHKDLNDEGQTIYFPGVGTTALDKDTNDHISKADKEITIVDTVRYTNLRVGKKYTVKGILMNQETGKKVLDADGQEVTASSSFTAETKDGTVDITFKFDGSKLAGKTVVAFENVYYKDKLYASHADLSDESQTVQIPKIGTKAADVKTGTDLSFAEKDITITDQVSYENLLIGKTYTVKGTLRDQETGKALEIDGKKITAEKTFVAEQASGSVDLSFTFDGSKLAGKTTVVFEDLTYNNVSVAVHEDLKDEGQTVHIPKIGTTAVSDATGINVNKAEKEVSLTDTVKYENLVKGREYTVTGKLMNQATGEPLLVNGKEVTAEKSFTPDKEGGSVDITFKFNADALAGQSVVAFETMTYEDHVIAVHTDINDGGQTVHFPEIKTAALDNASKDHVGFAGKEMTVIDTVKYTNLVKGKEYTVKGVLMDKETGKVVLDKGGNQVTAEKTFTAEKANGSVDLVFYKRGLSEAKENVNKTKFQLSGRSEYGTDVLLYAESDHSGKVKFENIELGKYTLTEVTANKNYVQSDIQWSVTCDENGNVSITGGIKDGKDLDLTNTEWYEPGTNGNASIFNEQRYWDFSIVKVDAENKTKGLQGAEFSLRGTSDLGTEVDQKGTSDAKGQVQFTKLEKGTYVLQETKAPSNVRSDGTAGGNLNYIADANKYLVQIDYHGTVTISGLEVQDNTGYFMVKNDRALDGKITITKVWEDDLTNEERPIPKIHITNKDLSQQALIIKGTAGTEYTLKNSAGETVETWTASSELNGYYTITGLSKGTYTVNGQEFTYNGTYQSVDMIS